MKKPNILKEIDIALLIRVCQEYVDFMDSDNINEDYLDEYHNSIYEIALETIYGNDCWDFINSKFE